MKVELVTAWQHDDDGAHTVDPTTSAIVTQHPSHDQQLRLAKPLTCWLRFAVVLWLACWCRGNASAGPGRALSGFPGYWGHLRLLPCAAVAGSHHNDSERRLVWEVVPCTLPRDPCWQLPSSSGSNSSSGSSTAIYAEARTRQCLFRSMPCNRQAGKRSRAAVEQANQQQRVPAWQLDGSEAAVWM